MPGDTDLSSIEDWYRGWDSANLSAPVEARRRKTAGTSLSAMDDFELDAYMHGLDIRYQGAVQSGDTQAANAIAMLTREVSQEKRDRGTHQNPGLAVGSKTAGAKLDKVKQVLQDFFSTATSEEQKQMNEFWNGRFGDVDFGTVGSQATFELEDGTEIKAKDHLGVKVIEVANGVLTTNPLMSRQAVLRLAQNTVARYPAMVNERS
jgi:hypothetical protein